MKSAITLTIAMILFSSCAFLAQEEPEIEKIMEDAAKDYAGKR